MKVKISKPIHDFLEDVIFPPLENYWGGHCQKGMIADIHQGELFNSDEEEVAKLIIECQGVATMPYIEDGHLVFSNWDNINMDMYSRIEDNKNTQAEKLFATRIYNIWGTK